MLFRSARTRQPDPAPPPYLQTRPGITDGGSGRNHFLIKPPGRHFLRQDFIKVCSARDLIEIITDEGEYRVFLQDTAQCPSTPFSNFWDPFRKQLVMRMRKQGWIDTDGGIILGKPTLARGGIALSLKPAAYLRKNSLSPDPPATLILLKHQPPGQPCPSTPPRKPP